MFHLSLSVNDNFTWSNFASNVRVPTEKETKNRERELLVAFDEYKEYVESTDKRCHFRSPVSCPRADRFLGSASRGHRRQDNGLPWRLPPAPPAAVTWRSSWSNNHMNLVICHYSLYLKSTISPRRNVTPRDDSAESSIRCIDPRELSVYHLTSLGMSTSDVRYWKESRKSDDSTFVTVPISILLRNVLPI